MRSSPSANYGQAQYLQLVAGFSPLTAGLAILPVMLAVGAMAVAASIMVRRFGYPLVFGAGAVVAAGGMLAFGRFSADGDTALAILASACIGAGIAPMMTLATDVVVGSAPPERSGAAAALSETASELGAALGIAVLGSVGAALYRSRVLDGASAEIPPELAEVAATGLGAARSVAGHLPPDLAAGLTDVARGAFLDGLGGAAVAGAGVLALAAIVCPLLLRRTSVHPG